MFEGWDDQLSPPDDRPAGQPPAGAGDRGSWDPASWGTTPEAVAQANRAFEMFAG